MVNLHSQFGWALTLHGGTPRGTSVMVFQSSPAAEGGKTQAEYGMASSDRLQLHMDQEGTEEEPAHHLHSLCFLTVDVI